MSEKTVCLVSGGIDSPVAAAVMSKEKEIVPLHFVLHPYYCEETFSISIRALRKLKRVVGFEQMVLFPWGEVLQKIFESLDEMGEREYSCVLCRRGMFEAASNICDMLDAESITTGEALGQKASQTLDNLRATSWGVKYPILRPLAGMDKQEIVQRSKELGLWMPRHAGCCNATPDRPRTEADPEKVDELFEDMELKDIIDEVAKNAEIIDLEEGNSTKSCTNLYRSF